MDPWSIGMVMSSEVGLCSCCDAFFVVAELLAFAFALAAFFVAAFFGADFLSVCFFGAALLAGMGIVMPGICICAAAGADTVASASALAAR
jgi:hypothetical protein